MRGLSAALVAGLSVVLLALLIPAADARQAQGVVLELATTPAGPSLVDTDLTVTARLTDGGSPLTGNSILISVTGANSRAPVSLDTDINGRVSLTYRGKARGTDTITAESTPFEGDPFQTTVEHDWRLPLSIGASPDKTSGVVGSTFTVDVKATADLSPAVRAGVTMRATMPGQPAVSLSGTTNASGRVAFDYTRQVPGLDRITVTASWQGQRAVQSLVRTWIDKPVVTEPTTPTPVTPSEPSPSDSVTPSQPTRSPTVPPSKPPPLQAALSLEPDGVVSETGTRFRVTAILTSGSGDPIPRRVVRFVATMDGEQPLSGSVTTDDEGEAEFTYSRETPGGDVVRAASTVDLTTVRDRIGHRWTTESTPPPPDGKLTIDTSSVGPGGDLAVRGVGCPAGSRVDITVRDRVVAHARADANGGYAAVGALPALPLGRYRVTATCAGGRAQAGFDLVSLAATTGTAGAAGLTAAAVLAFFILLGASLLREFGTPATLPTGS